MGQSGKPDITYSFADHARYLDTWFDALDLDQAILVGHDWGGALALDWATRHPDRVRGLAFLETIVRPMSWDELSPQARKRSETIRTAGTGEELALEQNLFVRQAFTGGVLTPVNDDDLATYLAPFPTPESRRPVLAWARQLPLGGEPTELVTRIKAYDAWPATSTDVPKLLLTFTGSPTPLITEELATWCATNIAALETVALERPDTTPRRTARRRSAPRSPHGWTATACGSRSVTHQPNSERGKTWRGLRPPFPAYGKAPTIPARDRRVVHS